MALAASAVTMLAMGTADRAAAVDIAGSLPLSIFNASQNGANLSVSTVFLGAPILVNAPGLDDYSPIPISHSYGSFSLNLSDLGAFSMSSSTNFGSFDAQTAGSFIVTQSADFLDVYLLGTYTPDTGLAAGLTPTATSLRISFNQSGESLSGAITLNTPPVGVPVPAPASLALFGAALAGLAIARGRLS